MDLFVVLEMGPESGHEKGDAECVTILSVSRSRSIFVTAWWASKVFLVFNII
jgi:hypothetical protein